MKEYIERAALMGALTAGTEQLSMREMAGAEAYNEFLALVNNIPAARRREMRTVMSKKRFGSQVSTYLFRTQSRLRSIT